MNLEGDSVTSNSRACLQKVLFAEDEALVRLRLARCSVSRPRDSRAMDVIGISVATRAHPITQTAA
jgi:hypothetical protein